MSYVKTEWATGDVITAQKLNNMEDGIEAVDEYADIFTADVSESVENWLDDHPEATTTVQDNAITTAKLQDGAVTTPKLANGSVTDDKLASDGIKAEVTDLKSDLNITDNFVSDLEAINLYRRTPFVDYQQGIFNANGYNTSYNMYINNVGLLPSGQYSFIGMPSGFQFAVFGYVSDTEGTAIVNWRTNDIFATANSDFKICIYKVNNTKITNEDIANIKNNFKVIKYYGDSPAITWSNNIAINDAIAELYIPNADSTTITFRTMRLDSSGIGRIAIGDLNDWVCYRDFSADAPSEIGKVYEIPEYRNSGINAYIVFKSLNFNESGTTIYVATDAIRNIKNSPKIGNYLCKQFEVVRDSAEVSTQKIVFLGDSIFGMERGSTSIPSLVGKYTGATTYNCALGGTEGNSHGDNVWKYFDFTELSKAIVDNDYTNQIAHESDSGVPSYFASVFDTLESLDFSTINLICLTYGGNDYNMSDSDVDTFVTAMCTNINRILTAYPNIRFMLMTPPYKRFLDDTTHEFVNDGDTKQNTFGKTLKDYAQSFKTISETIHMPYINAYDELGINQYNATQWFNTNDGSHPSEQGRKETAKLVAQYLKRMLYD